MSQSKPHPDLPSFTPVERLPEAEAELRWARCRRLLAERHPEAGGLLVVSRVHIYYLTGTLGSGLLWLPLEGEPVLMLRKGRDRARMESPLRHILPFRSYKEVPRLCQEAGSPLTETAAVDKNSFTWAMADMLTSRLRGLSFAACDDVMARARAVKTAFEQERILECGRIHALVMDELLPSRMKPGQTEAEVARIYVEESLRAGSDGLFRMNAHGEEMVYGYASCGIDGSYPTAYNGPLGCRGLHPATPFMGSRDKIWQKDQLMSVDMGCQKYGYNTDRTQCYFSGPKSSLPAGLERAHAACVEIIQRALERLRPGTAPAELWQDAQETAVRLGVRDGFMGLGPDQVPFLGHGVGLMLDEWPALARSFNEPLEAGMIIALEPKVSVPDLGMAGLEHTYLVTEGAPRPVTGTRKDMIFIE